MSTFISAHHGTTFRRIDGEGRGPAQEGQRVTSIGLGATVEDGQDRLEGRLDVERWERFHSDLVTQEDGLRARIESEEKVLMAGDGPADLGQILEILRHFRRVFDRLEPFHKKAVLRGMVADVRVAKTRKIAVCVEWHSPWSGESPASRRVPDQKVAQA
jgi:hypothetical protein